MRIKDKPYRKKQKKAGKMRENMSKKFGLAVCASLIGFSIEVGAIELVAHEATYEMGLLASGNDAKMTDIVGKTNFLMRKDCEGWISSEDYLLEFAYDTGDSALLASHFESWEELSGNLYSFEVDERSTYEEEKQFNGYASIPPLTDKPVAYFSMQPDVALSLPEQVYFPIAHTKALLERAEKGEKLFSANIFFGAEPDRAIKRTPQNIHKIDPTSSACIVRHTRLSWGFRSSEPLYIDVEPKNQKKLNGGPFPEIKEPAHHKKLAFQRQPKICKQAVSH